MLFKDKQKQLELYAKNYNSLLDFDFVISLYDLKEILPNLVGRKFLILGESSGTNTELFLDHADSIDVVEGSVTALTRASERLGRLKTANKKVKLHHTLWLDFSTENKYTDIIFIRGLEHEENSISLLNHLKSLLEPNGSIHLIVPNAKSLHRYLMRMSGIIKNQFYLREKDYKIGHVRYYDKARLVSELKEAGYSIKKIHGFFIKPFRNEIMSKITMNRNNIMVKLGYLLGKIFPNLGTQIYCVAKIKQP